MTQETFGSRRAPAYPPPVPVGFIDPGGTTPVDTRVPHSAGGASGLQRLGCSAFGRHRPKRVAGERRSVPGVGCRAGFAARPRCCQG